MISPNEQKTNFLEVSVIAEIIQMIEQIESKCQGREGEDVVNERIKQVAYAKILCNVYNKDITYLIKAYAQLGIAYLHIDYFDQAQEHLLSSFKLNENLSDQNNISMKEYQIKILINLSRCYLANNKLNPALQISERSLKMNQSLNGENDLSNADIYYVIAKVNCKLKNYEVAINNLKCMFNIYENIYKESNDKIAKVHMEIGQIYEITECYNDAIQYHLEAKKIWEDIIKDENYEPLFQIAEKLSELYLKTKQQEMAYKILKETEEKYPSFERSLKQQVIYQKFRIKTSNYMRDINVYLNELIKLSEILQEAKDNQKTLAKNYVSISCVYQEKKEYDKCFEYLTKAEQIFKNNGDENLANDMQQRKLAISQEEDQQKNKKNMMN